MTETKKTSPALAAIVLGVVILVFIFTCNRTPSDRSTTVSGPGTTSSQSTTTTIRDIKASVRFTGTQFIITNNESRAWTNVRFELNPGFISSGHTLKVERVEAGATYTVGAAQFVNSAAERFNPYTHKPEKFSILEFSSRWPEQTELEGGAYFSW